MSKHPHTSRYARLVAGFAASAFALLIASAVHYAEAQETQLHANVTTTESTTAKACSRTRKSLDSCAVRATKCIEKATAKQPLCVKKAEDRVVKCSNSAAKKLNDCQAKANTPEKLAKCAKKFDDARIDCNTAYDKAVVKCGTLDSVTAKCEEKERECEADAFESFTKKTGLTYEQACAA